MQPRVLRCWARTTDCTCAVETGGLNPRASCCIGSVAWRFRNDGSHGQLVYFLSSGRLLGFRSAWWVKTQDTGGLQCISRTTITDACNKYLHLKVVNHPHWNNFSVLSVCVCVALHHMDGRFDDTNLSQFYHYLRSSAQTAAAATTKGLFILKKERIGEPFLESVCSLYLT